MKKLVVCMFTVCLAAACMFGCTSSSTNSSSTSTSTDTSAVTDVDMQYITQDEAQKVVDDGDYLFVDLRKAEDYKAGHIPGAINADMDAAVNGDFDDGISTMETALKEATESETGSPYKLILICYSGKKYAQAGTNVLSEIGATMSDVYTLEGGMSEWSGDIES